MLRWMPSIYHNNLDIVVRLGGTAAPSSLFQMSQHTQQRPVYLCQLLISWPQHSMP